MKLLIAMLAGLVLVGCDDSNRGSNSLKHDHALYEINVAPEGWGTLRHIKTFSSYAECRALREALEPDNIRSLPTYWCEELREVEK